MKARSILLALALPALAGCQRSDSTGELVRELRAIRGALERLPAAASPQSGGAAGAADAALLQRALEPLRELVQTLASEQEALRRRQDAFASEMARWVQIVAPALQPAQARDLQALQQRLEKLEQELQAQGERHQQVQDLLLRAMDATADRLDAFLRTLGEIRGEGGPPGQGTGEGAGAPPAGAGPPGAAPPSGRQPPGEDEGDRAPAPTGTGSRTSRAGDWTPWILLAGGLLASLFLWRLWREPQAPPPPPVAEPDLQDWWVVVEELAQSMGGGPRPGRVAAGEGEPEDHAPPPDTAELPEPVEPDRTAEPSAAEMLDQIARQLGLPDPVGDPEPAPPPAAEPEPAPSSEPPPAPPAEAEPAPPPRPAELTWDEPCPDPEAAAERLRAWLLQEPRVLLRPAPEIGAGDGRLRLRLWVTDDLPEGARRHLWATVHALIGAGGSEPGKRGPGSL